MAGTKYTTALTLTAFLAVFQVMEAAGEAVGTAGTATVTLVQEENDVKRMQKQLLGPYHDIRGLTTSNICHAYIMFVQNVKSRHSNWTETDWNNAQVVLERLDKKSNSLYRIISVSDRAKIKALQSEFREMQGNSLAKRG